MTSSVDIQICSATYARLKRDEASSGVNIGRERQGSITTYLSDWNYCIDFDVFKDILWECLLHDL